MITNPYIPVVAIDHLITTHDIHVIALVQLITVLDSLMVAPDQLVIAASTRTGTFARTACSLERSSVYSEIIKIVQKIYIHWTAD